MGAEDRGDSSHNRQSKEKSWENDNDKLKISTYIQVLQLYKNYVSVHNAPISCNNIFFGATISKIHIYETSHPIFAHFPTVEL